MVRGAGQRPVWCGGGGGAEPRMARGRGAEPRMVPELGAGQRPVYTHRGTGRVPYIIGICPHIMSSLTNPVFTFSADCGILH